MLFYSVVESSRGRNYHPRQSGVCAFLGQSHSSRRHIPAYIFRAFRLNPPEAQTFPLHTRHTLSCKLKFCGSMLYASGDLISWTQADRIFLSQPRAFIPPDVGFLPLLRALWSVSAFLSLQSSVRAQYGQARLPFLEFSGWLRRRMHEFSPRV